MRDTTETLVVAFLGIIGIEIIEGWTSVLMAFIASCFIIFHIIMGVKRNKREKEKRFEDHQKHDLEMKLLEKKLKN